MNGGRVLIYGCAVCERMTAVVVVAAVLAATGTALSQPAQADAYSTVVATYRAGGDLRAVLPALRSWARKDFETAVDRIIARGDRAEVEAAAVLQLEFTVGAIGVSPASGAMHLDVGARIVDQVLSGYRRVRPMPPEVVEFASTWYGVAGSAYLSINDGRRAGPLISKALAIAPRSAPLQTLWGAVEELRAAAYNPDFWAEGSFKTRTSLELRRRLLLVADHYQKAINFDPEYAGGHLRLARAALLLGDLARARAEAERAEALASERAHRYLSALTLGAVHERQSDPVAARAAYERALAIVPRSQTATVALSYLDVIAGRPDMAQARAQAFMAAPADDHYWWEFKNGGLYHAGLDRLRKRARR